MCPVPDNTQGELNHLLAQCPYFTHTYEEIEMYTGNSIRPSSQISQGQNKGSSVADFPFYPLDVQSTP